MNSIIGDAVRKPSGEKEGEKGLFQKAGVDSGSARRATNHTYPPFKATNVGQRRIICPLTNVIPAQAGIQFWVRSQRYRLTDNIGFRPSPEVVGPSGAYDGF
ncbi:hypothetical protein LQ564_04720 [Massilia sp. G4R7]|uniref:Uncharacterized protein n=1 Tax=Massilia phyllostachyos TaxID=2898585 RepID=A0ABS8Q3T4_9BURK|nr:hypothetical protein [Massilia phyllostachyos]MCD2515611.1 hypothetical protein [Massilia phyllostachyos]